MSLAIGDRLGPYEVLSALGAGGMGEVYRARDATLKRDVALKILPDGFALDQERLARFKREAQVLASLNHSNIAAIYGFQESNGLQALVLELVEGPTLADRIGLGPIPVSEAIPIARQIAEALEAAHEQGIVHRDLKPANVKLRPDGTVKVLDFGLAKSLEPVVGRSGDVAASPTITSPAMTAMGIILGTAAYMSPEQAKGQPADKRSDVWAFGSLLYEMLSGQRAFKGDDVSDTLALVLKGEPDWSALPPAIPRSLQILLKRCLTRNRRARLADMSVVRYILSDDDELAEPAPLQPSPRRPLWRRMIGPGVAAIAAAGLAGSTVWLATRPSPPRVTRFALPQTGPASLVVDQQSRDLAITPEGTHIIYKGSAASGATGTQLFVRAIDTLEPTPLTVPGSPRAPFNSPDGKWIGFVEPGPVTLKKVAITGGAAVALAALDGASRGLTWGDGGAIIFATAAPATGLQRVSSNGGEPVVLTTPNRERGESDHLWPQFLPGGQAVLLTITATAGGIDAARVAVLDLRNLSAPPKTLVTGGSQAHYVSSGHLVYAHAGTLRAVAFDLDRLETIGTSVPVVPEVVTLANGTAEFDIARSGTLVYASGGGVAPPRTLVWVDRQGREEPIKGLPARSLVGARLSPDGTRVALEIRDRENDIWLWDFARGTLDRLTMDPGTDQAPVWTPDGLRVIFTSEAGGGPGSLFWQTIDGSGKPERLTPISRVQRASAVLKNGTILLSESRLETAVDIMALTFDKDWRSQPILESAAAERLGEVSPNGRWLAYESNDAGLTEVFVRPFPDVAKQKIKISAEGGGSQPLWARDGKELFYLAPNGALMSVTVQPDNNLSPGTANKLMDEPYLRLTSLAISRTYDVSEDGKRFLRIKPSSASEASASVVVVQNWLEELKQLVPPPK